MSEAGGSQKRERQDKRVGFGKAGKFPFIPDHQLTVSRSTSKNKYNQIMMAQSQVEHQINHAILKFTHKHVQ